MNLKMDPRKVMLPRFRMVSSPLLLVLPVENLLRRVMMMLLWPSRYDIGVESYMKGYSLDPISKRREHELGMDMARRVCWRNQNTSLAESSTEADAFCIFFSPHSFHQIIAILK